MQKLLLPLYAFRQRVTCDCQNPQKNFLCKEGRQAIDIKLEDLKCRRTKLQLREKPNSWSVRSQSHCIQSGLSLGMYEPDSSLSASPAASAQGNPKGVSCTIDFSSQPVSHMSLRLSAHGSCLLVPVITWFDFYITIISKIYLPMGTG